MTAKTLFVTGTDTGVGKTLAACALLRNLRAQGKKVCGFKPVASGCENGKNADALALMQATDCTEPYERINPVALPEAIAPHLAAAHAHTAISTDALRAAHDALVNRYDWIIAEGAGGWLVPYGDTWTQAEWVAEMEWPVILVVGLRLGCLNHALLTVESIRHRTGFAGWIANVLPPQMAACEENIETLRQRISAPLLGIIPEHAGESGARDALDLKSLLKPPPAPAVLEP
ncbi:MAG: dethiobiotin synthase [Pseudomonadota bacterium]